MKLNIQFFVGQRPTVLEGEVKVGDVYNSKGGRGGTKYWCVVAQKGRVSHMFGLDEAGEIVSSTSYGTHALVGRQLVGWVELPEVLGAPAEVPGPAVKEECPASDRWNCKYCRQVKTCSLHSEQRPSTLDEGQRTRDDAPTQCASVAKIEVPREEPLTLTHQEKPMSLNAQRRAYLEAASVLIGCHQNLERLRAQLAEAEAEHRHWSRLTVERLGEIVDDGTMADDGSDAPPLHVQMDGYFVRIEEDWHEYGEARYHEAVVTGPLPEEVPSIRRLLGELSHE